MAFKDFNIKRHVTLLIVCISIYFFWVYLYEYLFHNIYNFVQLGERNPKIDKYTSGQIVVITFYKKYVAIVFLFITFMVMKKFRLITKLVLVVYLVLFLLLSYTSFLFKTDLFFWVSVENRLLKILCYLIITISVGTSICTGHKRSLPS
jgi:hypothetical protein